MSQLRITPPDVYVADTGTAKGRGVFAARNFRSGEVIELAPVLVLPNGRKGLPQNLLQRTFCWAILAGSGGDAEAVVWGYGSLYNHANPANMSYRGDMEERIIRYVAARDITRDEELTINYSGGGGAPVSDDNSWFERHQITPI